MSGTFYSTGGLQRITGSSANVKWPLAAFLLAVVLAAGLVVWIERNTWSQVGRLQNELAAIRTESLHLGVHLRAGVWRLDGRLLRYQLSENSEEREGFHTEARQLSEQIQKTRSYLTTAQERDLVQQVEAVYEAYLNETAPLLEKGIRGIRRDTASEVSREISKLSQPLLRLCEELILAQRAAWDFVLSGSQNSLLHIKRSLQLSVLLLLGLLSLIVALIYRVFIAPLRSKLSQSEVVIERQEKLASLGTLAAGVAHEIRNPLTAIKFRLFSLKKSLPSNFAETEDIQIIGNEINRLERIVKDFIQFARPSDPALTSVSSQQILQDVHDLLKSQLGKRGIELNLEPAEPIWLKADKEQIKQVLINLVQNAAESIEHSGAVQLRARQGAARRAKNSIPVVTLEVSDTGKGIPPEMESRLFDPFFSTKDGGTGLGLPIAARIIEKHGGYIQYQTQQNRGTTFSIVLPRQIDDASTDSTH
jgi:signal transduction histidine kinase